MFRKVVMYSAATVLANTLGAAAVASPPGDLVNVTDVGPSGSIDNWFIALERTVPGGFGGMFFDENGDLNVYLVNPGKAAEAKATLGPVLQARLAARGLTPDKDGRPDASQASVSRTPDGEIRIRRGQYRFSELVNWHAATLPVLKVEGVVFTDNDEVINRLVVGVENSAAISRVEQVLAELKVPFEVVVFEEAEPIVLTSHTLRDRIRPVLGGIQINYPEFLCTLGFTALRDGFQGFVTNSHCTNIQGGVEDTSYNQPYGDSNYIGYEIADPVYFTGGRCPNGRRCRWSDSAFIDLTTRSSLGLIARTISWWLAPLTLDHSNPSFQIVKRASRSMVGDDRHKMGRTTGWSYGQVVSTCQNTNVYMSDITLLCQDRVSAVDESQIVDGGDSGSPVFVWRGDSVELAGVLWGKSFSGDSFLFSPMANIEFELGVLNITPQLSAP